MHTWKRIGTHKKSRERMKITFIVRYHTHTYPLLLTHIPYAFTQTLLKSISTRSQLVLNTHSFTYSLAQLFLETHSHTHARIY